MCLINQRLLVPIQMSMTILCHQPYNNSASTGVLVGVFISLYHLLCERDGCTGHPSLASIEWECIPTSHSICVHALKQLFIIFIADIASSIINVFFSHFGHSNCSPDIHPILSSTCFSNVIDFFVSLMFSFMFLFCKSNVRKCQH